MPGIHKPWELWQFDKRRVSQLQCPWHKSQQPSRPYASAVLLFLLKDNAFLDTNHPYGHKPFSVQNLKSYFHCCASIESIDRWNQENQIANENMEWFLGFTQICQRIPPPESLLLDPGHSLFLCSYHCKIPSLHCLLLIEEVVDGKQHAKAYGDELRLGQTGTLHKVESIPKAVARSHVALNCVDKHFFLHEVWEEFLSASLHSNFSNSRLQCLRNTTAFHRGSLQKPRLEKLVARC